MTIQRHTSWNPAYKLNDTQGTCDSNGNDAKYQLQVLDDMHGKKIKAILYIYTGRWDAICQQEVNNLVEAGLRNQIILVKNKEVSTIAVTNAVETLEGFRKVTIKVGQTDLSLLKREIEKTQSHYVHHQLTCPPNLLKRPLEIIRYESFEVKDGERDVPEVETRVTISYVDIPRYKEVWCGGAGKWMGKKKTVFSHNDRQELRNEEQVTVNHKHAVFKQMRRQFVRRLDGKEALYRVEEIGTRTVKL